MDLNQLTVPAFLAAAGLFIANQVWSFVTNEKRQLTDALQQNTLALHRLTVKLEFLEKKIEVIPSIEKDLDGLGRKVREMST